MSQLTYESLILATSGIQSYWPLDESSGNVTDIKAGNNGTANGSLTYSGTGTSYIGPGISAPGTGADYIDYGSFYAFSGTASMTVEAWIRPGASAVDGRILAKEKVLSPYAGWVFALIGGKLYYCRNKGDGTNAYYKDWSATTTALASGTWYHVAVTYSSGNEARLYVNGVLESATKSGTSDVFFASPYSVGTTGAGTLRSFICDNTTYGRLNARLMHVAVYNTELTAATLLDHYYNGVGTYATLPPTAGAATVSLPAPTVTITSPNVTVNATPLTATASLPTPVVTTSNYPNVILATSGLQSYWKLDDTGSSVADSKGSVTGTKGSAVTTGATALVPSSFGTSGMSFTDDSTNAKIDLGNNYKFSGTSNFSVEAWFKSTNFNPVNGSNHIISAYDGTKGWRLVCLTGSKNFYFARYDSGGSADAAQGTTPAVSGTTYHVVVTYDGSNIKLYVNGSLEATTASTRSISASSTNLRIGSPTDSLGAMIGTLDDISVYNTALSASTVADHYAGTGSASTSAVAGTASVALPMPGTGVSTTANVTIDTVASATASLPAPGYTTSIGGAGATIAAPPLLIYAPADAAGVTSGLRAPSVTTGASSTATAPPLAASIALSSPIVITTAGTAFSAAIRLMEPVVTTTSIAPEAIPVERRHRAYRYRRRGGEW